MQTRLLFFLLLLLCTGLAKAQFRVGPKLGGQLSRSVFVDKSYYDNYSSSFRPGYLGGLVLNYKVDELYSLHTEFLYMQHGRSLKGKTSLGEPIISRANYNYLSLPVLLRLSTHKQIRKNHLELYVNAGPSLNYWLGGKGKITSGEIWEFTGKETMPYTIAFDSLGADADMNTLYIADANRMQMSLDFGGGVIFDLGQGHHIMLDVRSSFGIGKTVMGEKDGGNYGLLGYKENMESMHHSLAVSAAYLIDFNLNAFLRKGKSIRKK